MYDYDNIKVPNNSYSSKEQPEQVEKKVDKVVKKGVEKKKKGFGRRLLGRIIAEDFETVKNGVIDRVIIPSIIDSTVDAVTTGVNIMFHGDDVRVSRRDRHKDYSAIYGVSSYKSKKAAEPSEPVKRSKRFDTYDMVFGTRGEAESVLSEMADILVKCDAVSVADYYALCGETAPFTYQNWGWEDLSSAKVIREYGKYIISLPKAVPLQ